jgi:RNA polymerase sigma-70 factor, ECF subfamily
LLHADRNDWDWHALQRRCRQEALRILRNPADADDVAQQAMLRAWQKRSACRTPGAPDAWFATIARNEAYRLVAMRKARNESAADLLYESPDARAARALAAIPERVDVRRAVARTTEHQRRLLLLRHVADYSHEQIADALDMNYTTVRVQLHRAHKRLATDLAAETNGTVRS